MDDFKLSTHFSFKEMTSNWRGGKIEARNMELGMSEPYLTNLVTLCNTILEPVRKKFMSPVIIASGFRYAEKVNGSWEGLDLEIRSVRQKKTYDARSQHTRGEAADIHVVGVSDRDVFDWIHNHCPNPFGQVIFEVAGRSSWVHVSIPGNRIQKLGGGYICGEVLDAYQDKLGRFYYQKLDTRKWS